MKGPSFCMTQNNARRLSPRLAAKHSFLFKKEKSSRKENLQMTTLSRQGVEPVCKGKRQADRVPLAGGGPGGPGPGRWAEHGPGGGVRGRAGPERRRLPKGGQAAALWTPAPPRPRRMTTLLGPAPQALGLGAVCQHVPAGLCHSLRPSLQDSRGGGNGTWCVSMSHPRAVERPSFLLGHLQSGGP